MPQAPGPVAAALLVSAALLLRACGLLRSSSPSRRTTPEEAAWAYVAEGAALVERGQLALALRRCSSALRLVPEPGEAAVHAAALWQRSLAFAALERHELALAETAAAAKAGVASAECRASAAAAGRATLAPSALEVRQQRRRLADIVSSFDDSSGSDGEGDASRPSPSVFVHASALFYR